jgi:hypothetical protein
MAISYKPINLAPKYPRRNIKIDDTDATIETALKIYAI